MADVRVGLLFDQRNPKRWRRPWAEIYARTLETCERADALGIDGLWFSEHHCFDDGYLPQPLTLAAAAAARTRRAVLGTAVMQPNLRHPAQLAEEAAVVDLICGGRLQIGIGAGYRIPEYELYGVDIGRRYRLVEEQIRTVRRLWAEGQVTPAPLQDEVRFWGGFYGPRGARLAGTLGMGLLYMSRKRYEEYLAALLAAGYDESRAQVSGLMPIVLADDPERTWAQIAPYVGYQHDSYQRHEVQGTDRSIPTPADPEVLRHGSPDGHGPLIHVLTPEEAATYLEQRATALPVEHVIFWASIGGMPDDVAERHVELASTSLRTLLASDASVEKGA